MRFTFVSLIFYLYLCTNKIIKMDIGSKSGYPSSSLSNFAGHRFIFDDVECNSMEGFLQSLKFKDVNMQAEVCKLIGKKAKFKGKNKKWWKTQTLYWKGIELKRDSEDYQALLDSVYNAMYEQSESFRNALKATNNATLTHSMGKNKKSETVLTESEFCKRLTLLRDNGKIESRYPGNDWRTISVKLERPLIDKIITLEL